MFQKLLVVFRIKELRNKVLLTLGLLAVYRLGFYIFLPIVDQAAVLAQNELQKNSPLGQAMAMMEIFSASGLSMTTIFGLGIMPYISASIIFQLLATVYPPLEALQKEGEAGRRKINDYTRLATVVLCFVQSFFWIARLDQSIIVESYRNTFGYTTAALTMTAGTMFLMWIGEQIDEYGIGNGISLLIMAGILSRMPPAIFNLLEPYKDGMTIGGVANNGVERLVIMVVVFLLVIWGVIAFTQAQRKIPTQSAKHTRGRKQYGGQRQYLPLKVNQAGVMPIIFASTILMFPLMIFQFLGSTFNSNRLIELGQSFSTERGFIYHVCYIGLIYFFCYFWTAISFNPKDMATNLQNYGSFIPGQRPGRRTAEYLERVMTRITFVGAAFLAVVAVIPNIVSAYMGIPMDVAVFFGGTGLLIVVSVALDLVQKIDSHLVMRNYSGLLES